MQLKQFENLREDITSSMTQAAKRAKVELLPGDIALSVRGDYVIANAFIAPPKGVAIEQANKLFLVYLSFPKNHSYAKKVPSGFYIIERVEHQNIPRAKVVSLEGHTVLELPLNIIKTEMPPEKYSGSAPYSGERQAALPGEPVTVAQAIIEQSQVNLYRNIVLQGHGVICYPRDGVWYWTWIVIVIFDEKTA
jgi:hypothetical protein